MIGFIIGTACLLGFVKMAFARGRFGRCGEGYGFGDEGCGARGRFSGGASCGHGGHAGPFGDHGGPFSRGGRDDGGEGEGRRGWGGRSMRSMRRVWLRGLFERLDTTPGQEKVILEAIDEAKKAAGDARVELEKSRGEAAEALRAPTFEAETLGAIFARQNAALEALQKSAAGALGKVHEALDDEQRKALAELIERGPRRWGHRGGPYRGRD